MTYKVTSSERTAASASEMETKAMLHLLCEDDDCNIRGFAIDFFNDVTGMDNNAFRLYDVQSKGEDAGPAALGEELVTLFKNYVSEFKDYFVRQILFVRRVTSSVLNNPELVDFSYADMKDESKIKLRTALIATCNSKTYIADEDITDEILMHFLRTFVWLSRKPRKPTISNRLFARQSLWERLTTICEQFSVKFAKSSLG